MAELLELLEALFALAPEVTAAAVLIAVIIDFLKWIGVLENGYAPVVAKGLNFVFWGIFWYAQSHGFEVELTEVVTTGGAFMAAVLALLMSPVAAKALREILKYAGWAFSYTRGDKALSLKSI